MICVIYTFSMTIQNIEDVMDRIMSLNRNLNEDSLRTLLSASGWDKEDIVEGLRIFKLRGGTSQAFSATSVAPAPTFIKAEPRPQTDYSFNIKKEEKPIPQEIEPEPVVEKTIPQIDEEPIKVVISSKPQEEKVEAPIPPVIDKEIEDDKPKKNLSAKIFSLILILILVILGLAYFAPSIMGDFIDTIFVKNNNQPQITNTIPNNPNQNINTVEATSSIINPSATDTNTINNSSTSLDNLLKEISSLRSELNSYKQASQSSKTIVKYISQKGSTGKAGRGISSITGTSTGFVINYTDDTSIIIPYSTTTIINILNSNSVCFRDMTSSSTQSVNDVCLDRDTVSKLIASSTTSH